jgi:hypothetical protein
MAARSIALQCVLAIAALSYAIWIIGDRLMP